MAKSEVDDDYTIFELSLNIITHSVAVEMNQEGIKMCIKSPRNKCAQNLCVCIKGE
jgi:hypothetical protein